MVKATPKTIIGLVVLSLMYIYAFSSYIPDTELYIWTILQTIFIIIRYINAKKLERYLLLKNEEKIVEHTKYFFYSLIYSAGVWNLAFLGIVIYGSYYYELIALAVMMGILTASISSISALYQIFVVYFVLMMTPLGFVMYVMGGHAHNTVLLFIAIFIPTILILARFVNHNIYEFAKVNEQLHEQLLKEKKLSITDPLTGLYNRRYFFDTVEDILKLSYREDKSSSFLMIDVDFFKKINDTYGHQAGDYILVELASLLENMMRKSDVLARVGGEEFGIFLFNTDKEPSKVLAEVIREKVFNKQFLYEGRNIDVSLSIGTVTSTNKKEDLKELYKIADKNLYNAKANGRNCVI